ncbi:MAG TPA: acyloxyacyl hydrolase [Edaphobacter sp.]|nr:acyloxyacyl hydrolase [Edaphobacter sp.]
MHLRNLPAALLSFLLALGTMERSQAQEPQYSFHQSFSLFGEYSNTSSRIILGAAQNRRFAALGLGYSRRLLHSRHVDWYYAPEVLPLVFLEDPVATDTFGFSDLQPVTQLSPTSSPCRSEYVSIPPDPHPGPPVFTFRRTCGIRWTYAGGISPLGQRLNFRPGKRLQPFLMDNAGFLVSPRDIPVDFSSRFNFTFEFGGGLEFFRTPRHSWSLSYRIHHLSNGFIGANNPGVDNQILRLIYSLGR